MFQVHDSGQRRLLGRETQRGGFRACTRFGGRENRSSAMHERVFLCAFGEKMAFSPSFQTGFAPPKHPLPGLSRVCQTVHLMACWGYSPCIQFSKDTGWELLNLGEEGRGSGPPTEQGPPRTSSSGASGLGSCAERWGQGQEAAAGCRAHAGDSRVSSYNPSTESFLLINLGNFAEPWRSISLFPSCLYIAGWHKTFPLAPAGPNYWMLLCLPPTTGMIS